MCPYQALPRHLLRWGRIAEASVDRSLTARRAIPTNYFYCYCREFLPACFFSAFMDFPENSELQKQSGWSGQLLYLQVFDIDARSFSRLGEIYAEAYMSCICGPDLRFSGAYNNLHGRPFGRWR